MTTRVLAFGDTGSEVVGLQRMLAAQGYRLSGTGYFGPATKTAVQAFQRGAGLDPDGEFGPATAAALAQASKSPAPDAPPPAVVSRPLWLAAGLALINTREAPGASDNPEILDWAKQEGGEISRSYTHDYIPWCALFANHCCTLGGVDGTGSLLALSFDSDKFGPRLAGPAVGAFAPMVRSGGGHIAIVVGRDQHGNLMMLGGNQSDAVNIKPFPPARPRSFRWPHGSPPPKTVGVDTLPIVRSDGALSGREN